MTAFWTFGAALAALALVLLLRPLLRSRKSAKIGRAEANISIYRDHLRELDVDLAEGKLTAADHARSRAELDARLLDDVAAPEAQIPAARPGGRRLALILIAVVPLFAAALYLAVGNPASLAPGSDPHAFDSQQLTALVDRLAARMRENPDDAEGWRLLGRSYAALGRFPESLDAYAKAVERKPRDADLLADMADVLATTRSERLQGEPEKLVMRALEIDPQNLKALALAGTAAFERKDFNTAARYWQRMLPLVPPESEDARSIQANIAEAQSHLKSGPPAAAALKGTVRLSPELKGKASPERRGLHLRARREGAADAARREARSSARSSHRVRARRLDGDGAGDEPLRSRARDRRRARVEVRRSGAQAGRSSGRERAGRERRARRQRGDRHRRSLTGPPIGLIPYYKLVTSGWRTLRPVGWMPSASDKSGTIHPLMPPS